LQKTADGAAKDETVGCLAKFVSCAVGWLMG